MIKTFEFEGKKYQVDMDKLLAPALSGDWRPMKVDQFDFKPYQTGHFLSATANTCTAFQMMRPDAFASITCTADFGEPRPPKQVRRFHAERRGLALRRPR
jgi:hypothetical protein